MTSRLSFLLLAGAVALLLPACGDGGSDLVGHWTIDKTHLETQLYDMGLKEAGPKLEQARKMIAAMPEEQRKEAQKQLDSELAQVEAGAKIQAESMTFEAEFKSDGTVAADIRGEKKNAKWTLDGEKLTITPEGEDPQTGTFRDGKIELKVPTPVGAFLMRLIRK